MSYRIITRVHDDLVVRKASVDGPEVPSTLHHQKVREPQEARAVQGVRGRPRVLDRRVVRVVLEDRLAQKVAGNQGAPSMLEHQEVLGHQQVQNGTEKQEARAIARQPEVQELHQQVPEQVQEGEEVQEAQEVLDIGIEVLDQHLAIKTITNTREALEDMLHHLEVRREILRI